MSVHKLPPGHKQKADAERLAKIGRRARKPRKSAENLSGTQLLLRLWGELPGKPETGLLEVTNRTNHQPVGFH